MKIRWFKPAKWHPKKMTHLEAAFNLIGPRGPCFFRAVAFVLDVPIARLMVGTFRGGTPEEQAACTEVSKEPFIHAWCEVGDKIYAPTAYEACDRQLVGFDKSDYYERNQAKDVVSMSRPQLLALSRKYGLGKYILYLTPLEGNLKFASVILDELGVKHRLSKDNGLLPGE
jgi:hypothetical protein